MAEIRPFRAWRYGNQFSSRLDELTSPLFDVVDNEQREILYQNPLNSIHLSVPRGSDPGRRANGILQKWKEEKIIIQDDVPAIYVYYQYFSLPGSAHTYCRKGFIAHLRIYDWTENVLLRHESTLPFSVEDRVSVLDETRLNTSPTHGLYADPLHEIEDLLDQSMATPLSEAVDYQGVRDVLSVISDPIVILQICRLMSDRQIILADGHHRYEGSLQYMNRKKSTNPRHSGNEGYNFHLMYFTNTESPGLRILPTHRLVFHGNGLSDDVLLNKLSVDFHCEPIGKAVDIPQEIAGKKWTFGLITKDGAYTIRLKAGRHSQMPHSLPDSIRKLDLSLLHHLVFEKSMGLSMDTQLAPDQLGFERDFHACVMAVNNHRARYAFITNALEIDEVRKVCVSGATLPPKSTYFYPKVICGFLFSSIRDDES
ncbi:MAG: DUF1015 domain-containing protein [Cyclobacteriaceae bacterium]|nr:DUF1015 domain-containing protein [Cyclobacteriaceae bacterium]